MIKIKFVFIVIIVFLFIKYCFSQTPKISCSIETICNKNPVFRISDLFNAKAELFEESNYQYIVCCNIENTNFSVSNEKYGGFIGLSHVSDALVEIGNFSNYPYHLVFKPYYGSIFCSVEDSCVNYDTCMVSISDLTEAYVADCYQNPYQKKICCSFITIDLTINTNVTKIHWNEGIKVWGKATKNGEALENADVFVKSSQKIFCQLKTNSSGDYECSFFIEKKRIERIDLYVNVIDPITLQNKTKQIFLKNYIGFGYEKTGENILCEEKQKLIQNPDGSIDIAKINICLWK